MKKTALALGLVLLSATSAFSQMQNSIKINEVMTNNTSSLQDKYGNCGAWVELSNISHTTYNIRGMFLTTDSAVLDKNMSVPERMKRMSQIPNGDPATVLGGHQQIVYFANSNPARSAQHLKLPIDATKSVWIAIYNGNAVDLIDSVTVPVLATNESYARKSYNENIWEVKKPDFVTPGIGNDTEFKVGKVAKVKRDDPHGFGITLLCMGIVFSCLALIYVFLILFGWIAKSGPKAKKAIKIQPIKAGVKAIETTKEISHKTNNILQDGIETKGIDKEIYIAVISMALKQYQDNVHDVESGVITITPKNTDWNNGYNQITHFHE